MKQLTREQIAAILKTCEELGIDLGAILRGLKTEPEPPQFSGDVLDFLRDECDYDI